APQRRVRPPRRTPRARLCRRRHAPRTPRARARGIARGAPRRACAGPSPPRGSVEVALQLVEEALGPAVRVLVARTLELAEQPALLLVQLSRHPDVDENALVSASEALEHGHAPAAQHLDL